MNPEPCHSLIESIDWSSWIPVFPLPNVVLLPKAVQPLHIFEQRYRVMTAEALKGQRLIAMALLMPGFESLYHTLEAAIHPMLCLGRILREEQMSDGRYNFLIQGITRATIIEENLELEYRRARLEPVLPAKGEFSLEHVYRHELIRMISDKPLCDWARQAGWLDLINCPTLSFSELLDVLASAVLASVQEKQAFLEEPDVGRRAKRLCADLSVLAAGMKDKSPFTRNPRAWPPSTWSN